MRRFFLDNSKQSLNDSQIELTGDEFHHLKNVCRLEEGERIEVLDGHGKIALATIAAIGKKSAAIRIESVKDLPPPPHPQVEIILCVPRFQKVDFIIQKSVELGALAIHPVVSERSFVKKISGELKGRTKRWEKIAVEACKQSGRAWPMKVNDFTTLEKKIADTPKGEGLFLYEGDGALEIKDALGRFKSGNGEGPKKLTIFIGAEGGFSPGEVEKFQEAGMEPVTLGSLVLRVETACLAILSVIQYEFGGMRQR